MQIESILQTKNRSEPAKNRFSVALAGRFESYLVTNPEDRFSHDVAHLSQLHIVKISLL